MLPPDMTPLGRDLYAELRRRWLAGGRRPFLAPHRELAEILGCSAGAIGRHMQFLDDEALIARAPYRNKYLITIPDGPTRFDAVHEPSRDRSESWRDRSHVGSSPAAEAPIAPADPDSAAGRPAAEPPEVIDHFRHNGTHDSLMQQQQQTRASADYWVGRQGDQAALRAELAGEDDAALVGELFRRHPTITLTDFAREVAAAASRPNVYCPPALALKALAAGERVTAARASPPSAPAAEAPPDRPPRRPKDRWADERPDAKIAGWRAWEAEQRELNRRYGIRAAEEGSYATTT